MNLLLLSDKPESYSWMEKSLSSGEFHFHSLRKKGDYFSLIRKKRIRIVILDLARDELSEFAPLGKIKNIDPLIEVIIAGPRVSPFKMAESIKAGANDYLIKPMKAETLQPVLEKIKEKSYIRHETFKLEKELTEKYIFQGMVGKNLNMLEVVSLVERVARHSVPVLVTGETGTGKEMVARALHNLSPRVDKNLVICDCTAIPETLFESELFGYQKGAFTGADKAKDGLFKEADGGTIFLDEIGEIPISIQSKLLRVLEEHQFRPLGSNKNVKVDVRVVSATSRDIGEEIKKGKFREDLFHRINVVEIKFPPLRKRKEDIPLLCSYFIKKYNQKYGKKILGISQRAKRILMEYFWPGNVRQLENIIERSVMFCHESFLDIKGLPDNLKEIVSQDDTDTDFYPFSSMSLDEVEKRHIIEVLKRAKNNKQMAARILNLSRQALYRKLNKHNIPL